MKRLWALAGAALGLLLCLTLSRAAWAEGKVTPPLPDGVAALLDAAHPDMTVAVYDGWGNEDRGQFAMALTDGQRYVLCIAERAEGDAAYTLSVDNPHALREGITPYILVDTIDTLFIGVQDPDTQRGSAWMESALDRYAFAKGRDGLWHFTGLEHYRARHVYSTQCGVVQASMSGGQLSYAYSVEDENGNVLVDQVAYLPIPVSEAFEASFTLDVFDIASLGTTPQGIVVMDGLCDGLLGEGDALLDVDCKPDALLMIVQKPDGARRLRVYDGAALRETRDLPADARFDTGSAGEQDFILSAGEQDFILNFSFEGRERTARFACLPDGTWSLASLFTEDSMDFGVDWVATPSRTRITHRNDGFVYGEHPWRDLFEINFDALPQTYAEALSRMNTAIYALVNNPNPEDRLHLREEPDRSAKSLGKFYNRTPIQVLGRDGEWTHVRIGNAENGLTGYMMTQYLTFDAGTTVACAFPQNEIIYSISVETGGVQMQRELGDNAERLPELFTRGLRDFIIGILGDDYYVVLRSDGAVGYVNREQFSADDG